MQQTEQPQAAAAENVPPIVVSLSGNDPRIKLAAIEDGKIAADSVNLSQYLAEKYLEATDSATVLGATKNCINAVPCKVIRAEFHFDQPILLEVFPFFFC